MNQFIEFAKERARLSAEKYTLADGRNAGLVRDNPVDVLEELADAYNVSLLWIQHYVEVYGFDVDHSVIYQIAQICDVVIEIAEDVDRLAKMCDILAIEDVERLVPWRND